MFGPWLSKGIHLQEIVECPFFLKKLSSCAKAKVKGNVKYKKPASYHSLQMNEKNAEQDMPASIQPRTNITKFVTKDQARSVINTEQSEHSFPT